MSSKNNGKKAVMAEKPIYLTKLKPLPHEEEKAFKKGVGKERDAQQAILEEARKMRTDISLTSRVRYTDFLQKLGELSLTFGAALIPLIIASNARKDIKTPAFALVGAALYLVNGVSAVWLTKMRIEQDGDDSPHIGLEEEIMTYPFIYAKNKLILEPNNIDFANEQIKAEWNITHQPAVKATQKRPSVWADILAFNFVIASVLVAGTLWPYRMRWYWLGFTLVALFMIILIGLDYRRAVENQKTLQKKHEKIAKIKSDFGKWRNEKTGGK